jgi:hypothetical protein
MTDTAFKRPLIEYTTAPVAFATIYPWGHEIRKPVATPERLRAFIEAMHANEADFTIEYVRD